MCFDVHLFCSDYSPSYDLLCEEDPDDFVNVDIPEDLSASDTALMPPTGGKDPIYAHLRFALCCVVL